MCLFLTFENDTCIRRHTDHETISRAMDAGFARICGLFTFCRCAEPNRPRPIKAATLYVVGYAHLDTEWRWEYPQVIDEYLRKTMEDNFALFGKYPHYIFNFSGANRYRPMRDHYPADFARLK